MEANRTIVLIPAYQPGQSLISTVKSLIDRHFSVVVVDDGSGPAFMAVFDALPKLVSVIRHRSNRGKGAALKTGYRYIQSRLKHFTVITADADGQHDPSDIEKVAMSYDQSPGALLLGSRSFENTDIPMRSRFGNKTTEKVFSLATGLRVRDTQTGLRAFDQSLTEFMCQIPGDRFEYEMNVLLRCSAAGVPIRELPITTIYQDGNTQSHFRPVNDSLRIYAQILKFASSSLLSFALDYVLFITLVQLTISLSLATSVIVSNIAARVVSAGFNYTVNRRFVFRRKNGLMRSAGLYALLAATILGGNTLFLTFLTTYLHADPTIAKLMTEISFFALSFIVQRRIVFVRGNEGKS